jgi:formamidopyrimidine-DNA glycosylase
VASFSSSLVDENVVELHAAVEQVIPVLRLEPRVDVPGDSLLIFGDEQDHVRDRELGRHPARIAPFGIGQCHEARRVEVVMHANELSREHADLIEVGRGHRPNRHGRTIAAPRLASYAGVVPELPDVEVYVEHIAARTVGHPIERIRLASPFVLRTATPPLAAVEGREVAKVTRLGKRVVLTLAGEPLHVVIHLMVAGRFRWKDHGAPIPGKVGLAAFDFGASSKRKKEAPAGTLILTEASTKKRASLHLVRDVAPLDPGGLEVLGSTVAAFAQRLRSENHTLKRALTDPHLFSGIGNSYSDEILHQARMSPVKLTSRLTDAEITTLHAAIREVLTTWTARLREEAGDFPEKVTAFRPEMAVHGKYGKPCPRCGDPVQRIRYADNESNYCATCQTDGKLLADRSLSRLMRGDWPKTLEELEAKKEQGRTTVARPGSVAAREASFIPQRKS